MKRLISLFLVVILCATQILVPVSASTITNNSTAETDYTQFLSVSHDGYLVFNVQHAQEYGISLERIDFLISRVEYMNMLVRDYGAYIDDNFCAVIHLQSSRANGVCDVRTYVHGLTEIYMDSDVAAKALQYLSGMGDISTVAGVLGMLMQLTKFRTAAPVLGNIATTAAGVILVYSWQIRNAAAPNRGIVMSILNDGTTATPIIGYSSQ